MYKLIINKIMGKTKTINKTKKMYFSQIKENGTKRYNTQYARLFSCVYTKEEYAAQYMEKIGIPVRSIGKVALALANDKGDRVDTNELVNELEAVIKELKAKGE